MPVKAYIRTQRIVVDPADNSIIIVNAGPQGPAGPSSSDGIPTGGATGEILAKASNTNFDTEWVPPPAAGADGADGVGVPTGGTTNQVLAKVSGVDYATGWVGPYVTNKITVGDTEPTSPAVNDVWIPTT